MARRAPSRCTQCRQLATHHGRCDDHQVKPWERSSANTRALTGSQRAHFRAKTLEAAAGICEWCGKPATEADHKLAIGLGGDPHDWENNGQALCTDCHDLKTKQDNADIRAAAKRRTY